VEIAGLSGIATAIMEGFGRMLSEPIRDSRILLIVVTSDSEAKNPRAAMSAAIGRQWERGGYARPQINREQLLNSKHFVAIYSYEFHKEDRGDPHLVPFEKKRHTVAKHLEAYGLTFEGLLK
jgi:hypothetical protein